MKQFVPSSKLTKLFITTFLFIGCIEKGRNPNQYQLIVRNVAIVNFTGEENATNRSWVMTFCQLVGSEDSEPIELNLRNKEDFLLEYHHPSIESSYFHLYPSFYTSTLTYENQSFGPHIRSIGDTAFYERIDFVIVEPQEGCQSNLALVYDKDKMFREISNFSCKIKGKSYKVVKGDNFNIGFYLNFYDAREQINRVHKHPSNTNSMDECSDYFEYEKSVKDSIILNWFYDITRGYPR